jgi:hypothetical protein
MSITPRMSYNRYSLYQSFNQIIQIACYGKGADIHMADPVFVLEK